MLGCAPEQLNQNHWRRDPGLSDSYSTPSDSHVQPRLTTPGLDDMKCLLNFMNMFSIFELHTLQPPQA